MMWCMANIDECSSNPNSSSTFLGNSYDGFGSWNAATCGTLNVRERIIWSSFTPLRKIPNLSDIHLSRLDSGRMRHIRQVCVYFCPPNAKNSESRAHWTYIFRSYLTARMCAYFFILFSFHSRRIGRLYNMPLLDLYVQFFFALCSVC